MKTNIYKQRNIIEKYRKVFGVKEGFLERGMLQLGLKGE